MGKREDEKLFQACRMLDLALAQEAIQEGANVNAYAPHQPGDFVCYNFMNTAGLAYPPLCLVAMHARRESSELSCQLAACLLNAGADIGLQDRGEEFQNTCLHWAIANFNAELSYLLIERDVERKNINKIGHPEHAPNTPLILSFKVALYESYAFQDTSFMSTIPLLLLARGAETVYSDFYSQTALHWAAIVKAPCQVIESLLADEVINGLLRCGVKPFRKNLFGFSPADLYQQAICFCPIGAVDAGDYTAENGSFAELFHHFPLLLTFPSIEAKCLQTLNKKHPIDRAVVGLFAQKQAEEERRIAGIRAATFLPPPPVDHGPENPGGAGVEPVVK